ncbi:hypothetical protein OIE66_21110 [Nonomuraea sp. NBC_01738]|uniref:hypothetical protein n=1 Tax=Nonomuraea sp. NBC_01738 TaxID=2976003 RepID=UPI002E0DD7F4|nr:hypothetical protein OIE66_21110 [Nonomuraea sp. NBC_01738]
MTGYSVYADSLQRQARVDDELARHATTVQTTLRAAFDRDRNTLGNDEYGAELAKKLPGIESGIFDALMAHIGELERAASGLRVSARNYQGAEHPPVVQG